jgi:hypothetical protein
MSTSQVARIACMSHQYPAKKTLHFETGDRACFPISQTKSRRDFKERLSFTMVWLKYSQKIESSGIS